MKDWNYVEDGVPKKGILVDVMDDKCCVQFEGIPSEEVKWKSRSPVWYKWREHTSKDSYTEDENITEYLAKEIRWSGYHMGDEWSEEVAKFVVDKLIKGGWL